MRNQQIRKVACFLALLLYCSSSKADINCPTDVVGLCTPDIAYTIIETVTEESYAEGGGVTTITTTNTETTVDTVVNTDSGDILDGDNDFVASTKEGDMDYDWGGQGPASMPTGSTCGQLGADKCAQITGSGNSTSTMGVSGMGTTFIQTIDISDLNISNGGKTTYTIKVDKQDAADSIYMHITGKDGSSVKFAGTDVLSAAGVDTGYASYSGGFDFGGNLTSLIVEIGGRDINLAIGPVFDDVSINTIYNVISQVITNSITTVEQWVSLNIGGDTELELVEDLIGNNDFEETDGGFIEITPITEDTEDYSDMDSVEAEIDDIVAGFDEIPTFEVEIPTFEMPDTNTNIDVDTIETNIEAEIESQIDIDTKPPDPIAEPEPEVVPVIEKAEEGEMVEVEAEKEEVVVAEKEVEPEPEKEEVVVEEKEAEVPERAKKEVEPEPEKEVVVAKKEPQKKVKTKEQKKADKQKAASKIVKKMKSKASYYDDTSQQKTLIIMQVVSGNAKDFFLNQNQLQDIQGFFSNLPSIPDGNLGASPNAFAFFGSGSQTMNEMIELQYK
jgi:hypothetical protein